MTGFRSARRLMMTTARTAAGNELRKCQGCVPVGDVMQGDVTIGPALVDPDRDVWTVMEAGRGVIWKQSGTEGCPTFVCVASAVLTLNRAYVVHLLFPLRQHGMKMKRFVPLDYDLQ